MWIKKNTPFVRNSKGFSHAQLGINMKALILATTVASLALVPTAKAASFTFGNLIITQISPENPTTFDNLPTGPTGFLENSTVCDSAYCGAIQLSSDGGVANGTSNLAATPAGDTTNYAWGVNGVNSLGFNGAEVVFNPAIANAFPNSFNIDWGSIDALTTNPDGSPRYDNTLSVHTLANTVDSVTGSQLAAALVFGVNGFGSQTSANDNQWFNIRDTAGPIVFFTASSTNNAFEFDMGSSVPEPSTWAMMMLGFAGLGYAAFRRSAKAPTLAT
jgi:PEP-CTERM motif